MQGFSAGRLLRRRLAATAVASASAVPLGRCLRPVQSPIGAARLALPYRTGRRYLVSVEFCGNRRTARTLGICVTRSES